MQKTAILLSIPIIIITILTIINTQNQIKIYAGNFSKINVEEASDFNEKKLIKKNVFISPENSDFIIEKITFLWNRDIETIKNTIYSTNFSTMPKKIHNIIQDLEEVRFKSITNSDDYIFSEWKHVNNGLEERFFFLLRFSDNTKNIEFIELENTKEIYDYFYDYKTCYQVDGIFVFLFENKIVRFNIENGSQKIQYLQKDSNIISSCLDQVSEEIIIGFSDGSLSIYEVKSEKLKGNYSPMYDYFDSPIVKFYDYEKKQEISQSIDTVQKIHIIGSLINTYCCVTNWGFYVFSLRDNVGLIPYIYNSYAEYPYGSIIFDEDYFYVQYAKKFQKFKLPIKKIQENLTTTENIIFPIIEDAEAISVDLPFSCKFEHIYHSNDKTFFLSKEESFTNGDEDFQKKFVVEYNESYFNYYSHESELLFFGVLAYTISGMIFILKKVPVKYQFIKSTIFVLSQIFSIYFFPLYFNFPFCPLNPLMLYFLFVILPFLFSRVVFLKKAVYIPLLFSNLLMLTIYILKYYPTVFNGIGFNNYAFLLVLILFLSYCIVKMNLYSYNEKKYSFKKKILERINKINKAEEQILVTEKIKSDWYQQDYQGFKKFLDKANLSKSTKKILGKIVSFNISTYFFYIAFYIQFFSIVFVISVINSGYLCEYLDESRYYTKNFYIYNYILSDRKPLSDSDYIYNSDKFSKMNNDLLFTTSYYPSDFHKNHSILVEFPFSPLENSIVKLKKVAQSFGSNKSIPFTFASRGSRGYLIRFDKSAKEIGLTFKIEDFFSRESFLFQPQKKKFSYTLNQALLDSNELPNAFINKETDKSNGILYEMKFDESSINFSNLNDYVLIKNDMLFNLSDSQHSKYRNHFSLKNELHAREFEIIEKEDIGNAVFNFFISFILGSLFPLIFELKQKERDELLEDD